MTRTLLLLCVLACALPATASAGSLSMTTPPDAGYSEAKADVVTTISGTSEWIDQNGSRSSEQIAVFPDRTAKPCAATVAAEHQQLRSAHFDDQPSETSVPPPGAGDFSEQFAITLYNVPSPSDWKLCGYLIDPQAPDSAPPAAAASTGVFTLTNPKAPTGADRAGFSFVIAKPRHAVSTIKLHPGDLMWLGGSFHYGVNQYACASDADADVTWFSPVFKGSKLRSHGEPAVIGQTDSLSGLTLKYTLPRTLKPGKYPIQLACDDGSLASPKQFVTITKK